jgi:hypothetical protein
MLFELNPEKVRFIIVQMRKLDELSDAPMDDTSNATDDGFAFRLRNPRIPRCARNWSISSVP